LTAAAMHAGDERFFAGRKHPVFKGCRNTAYNDTIIVKKYQG